MLVRPTQPSYKSPKQVAKYLVAYYGFDHEKCDGKCTKKPKKTKQMTNENHVHRTAKSIYFVKLTA